VACSRPRRAAGSWTGRWWAAVLVGCAEVDEPDLGRKDRGKEKGSSNKKTFKQMSSNMNLNSNIQKQCTSLYATVNSYISLFN
jgi:hypothetical protein